MYIHLRPGRLLCPQAVAVPVAGEDLRVRGAERVHHWGQRAETGVSVCPARAVRPPDAARAHREELLGWMH